MLLEVDEDTFQLQEYIIKNALLGLFDFAVCSLIIFKMQSALLSIQVFRVYHGSSILVGIVISNFALTHPR
jgi:hypothetical protein